MEKRGQRSNRKLKRKWGKEEETKLLHRMKGKGNRKKTGRDKEERKMGKEQEQKTMRGRGQEEVFWHVGDRAVIFSDIYNRPLRASLRYRWVASCGKATSEVQTFKCKGEAAPNTAKALPGQSNNQK